jgi:glycosyltransferase involved in cell wall biosynthesis
VSPGSRSESAAAPPSPAASQNSWRDDPLRFHHHLASFFSRGGPVLWLGAASPLPLASPTVVIELAEAPRTFGIAKTSAVRGRLSQLPFSDEAFDLALRFEDVTADLDLESILAELARVVARDGVVLMRVPTAAIAPGEDPAPERLHRQVSRHLPWVQMLAEESPGRVAFLPDAQLSGEPSPDADLPPALIVVASPDAHPDVSWEGLALARLEAFDGLVAELENELRDRDHRLGRSESRRHEIEATRAQDRSDLELSRARCATLEERTRILQARLADLETEVRTRRESQRELGDLLARERSARAILGADLAGLERRLESERLRSEAERDRREARRQELEDLERSIFELGHRLCAMESEREALLERIAVLERQRFDPPRDLLDHAIVTVGLAARLAGRVGVRLADAAGRVLLAAAAAILLLPLLVLSLVAILVVELTVALQVKARTRTRSATGPPLAAGAFSVVIPLGRAAALDRELLAANCAHLARDDLDNEIIVVLHEADAELRRWLGARQPEVVVLDPGLELDFAEACNLGARRARRPHLLFLGAGVRLEDTTLHRLRPHFSHPATFALACRSEAEGEARSSGEPETGLTWGAPRSGRLLLGHSTPPVAVAMPALWAPGRAAAFRRDRFLALGGFEGELFPREPFRSLDLSFRAWQRGWTVLLAPEARVRLSGRDHAAIDRDPLPVEELTFALRNISSPGLLLGSLAASLRAAASGVLAAHRSSWHRGVRTVLSALRHLGPCLLDRLHCGHQRSLGDLEVFSLAASPLRWRGRYAPLPVHSPGTPLSIVAVAEGSLLPARNRQASHFLGLLEQLAREHRVSVVLLVEGPEEVASQRALGDRFARVVCVRRDAAEAAAEGPLLPRELGTGLRDRLRETVESVALEQQARIVHYEADSMAAFAARSADLVNVLRQRELRALSLARRAASGRDRLERLRLRLEEARALWFELGTVPRLDAFLTALPRERSLLAGWDPGLPPGRIAPAPCGVPVSAAAPLESRERRLILGAGDLRTPLGRDAARRLARDIVAPMAERDLRLEIRGPGTDPELRLLERDPRIEICETGWEDRGANFARAGAFVFASRLAAGVQIEILDALAAGVAVVTTPEGAEGIPLVHREHALIARTPGEFRAALRRLWTDDDLWRRLTTAGHELAGERFRCETAARDLAGLYQRVLGEKESRR